MRSHMLLSVSLMEVASYNPMLIHNCHVLLMTLQNASPGLDYERDKKFSKSFKQMTTSCLVKDPSKRPSVKKFLTHSFFKQARSNDYILRTLLKGLPALGDHLKALKGKEEDMLAQKKIPDGQMEEMSQGGVFLLPGCCDPFNEKALRASQGASFQLPIFSGTWTHLEALRNKFHLKIWAGHPESNEQSKPVSRLSQGLADSLANLPLCLVMGCKGSGLSAKTTQMQPF